MTGFPQDRLVFSPDMVDLSRSPLAGDLYCETFVLGAFNPALTRLDNGNLLMMVRVAEAVHNGKGGPIRSIRRDADRYVLDVWPREFADTRDPRTFTVRTEPWRVMALTSLSWLLPVELAPDGLSVVAVHYDREVAPAGSWQCYGIEDARISRIGKVWWMTTCSVSPERHSTTLYSSADGLDWRFEGIVLDHQNKDMLIFEGLIDGKYWAQTRPLGDLYFAYPPGSEWRAGPSINLASSPDCRHWQPCLAPGIRPRSSSAQAARIGGGTPPILTQVGGQKGWLSLWHGVEPKGVVGIYRTYWSLLDEADPSRQIHTSEIPLLESDPALTASFGKARYVADVVFSTGIVEEADHFIVASGENDLACRLTHIPRDRFAWS